MNENIKKIAGNSQYRVEGKVAIVTGASGNIGGAIACALAGEGADVIVHYKNGKQRADDIVNIIKEVGRRSTALYADATNYQDVETLVKLAYEEFGRIDILVNNAGMCRDKLMITMSAQDWDDIVNINLTGTLNFCKLVTPYMIDAGHGRIINIGSITGLAAQVMRVNYGAAKRAVVGLTKCLSRELSPKGILVNVIAPQIIEGGLSDYASPRVMNTIKAMTPIGRLGTADDVAGAVIFLASDESQYISGSVINLTGGLVTWQI